MLSLIHAVAGRPWAIRAEIAFHVRGLLAKEGIAGLRHLAELKEEIHARDGRMAGGPGRPAGGSTVAVIPVIGTLTQRVQAIGSVGETRSTADVAAEVRAAALEPSVDGVVLEVDSPGGEVFGVPEAWASIRESARMKPVVAHANSVAASAALYLASAAREVWVTPSGLVGSVGVYSLHVDASKALEQMGEAWDFIVATKSPYKIEGNPAGPLTGEARAHAQDRVDEYMGMFVRDLAKGRGVSEKHVEGNFGGGRMLGAGEAVDVRMADYVGTFDAAIRRAAQLAGPAGAGRPRAEVAPLVPMAVEDPVELAARAAVAGLGGVR
jgi:signal peptide peptidase SppA